MKLLIVSLAAALLLLNCKKSRVTPEAALETAVAMRPTTVFADNGESFNLIYDQHGQLLVHTAGDATHYYKPGNDHFLTQLLKTSNEKIIYKHAQRDAQNRIIQLDRYKQDMLESTISFEYNSDGYLSKRKGSVEGSDLVHEYIYAYDAGNLVKIEEYENAVLKSTLLLEYYNSRFNSVGIDLFDFKQIGFVTDAQFGKQSKNLVKSLKAVAPGEQTNFTFQYFYKTDANGFVESMEIETNNETIRKYNFILL